MDEWKNLADGQQRKSSPAHRTALVIDDEEHVREFVTECLEAQGYRVDTASNATEAGTRLRAQRYDLVVSDIKMPGKSGIDLFQEMLQDQPDLAARFIFMTGDIMSGGTMEFLQAQQVRYLLKPFTMTDLLGLLPKLD